jgi:hypothetical protein
MNIKTASVRIVIDTEGQPTLQFRARRLIDGEHGLMDAGWMPWETVPIIDDIEAMATGGRHTCKQIYSGVSGCGSKDGQSRESRSSPVSPCTGLSDRHQTVSSPPGCGCWMV